MIDEAVGLHTLKLAVLVVTYGYIANPPVVTGAYPVTAVMSALGVNVRTSVVAPPVAVAVTTVAHAPDVIAPVPSAAVPEATVKVTVPEVCPVPPWATGRADARWVAVTWLEVFMSTPVFAIELSVSVETTGELVTACVEPAKCAMPAPGDVDTTQVEQVMFPVEVVIPSGLDAVTAGVPVPDPHVTVAVPAAAGTV